MGLLLKLLATLISLLTSIFVLAESARKGLLIATTAFAILKMIVLILFIALLLLVFYLLIRTARENTHHE